MAKKDKLLMACMFAALFAACGCAEDKKNTCESSADCGDTSIYMCNLDGVCVEKPDAHCNNRVKDADESDVDCGGAKCAKCVNGKKCNEDKPNRSDCGSGYCNESHVCAPMKCETSDSCSNFGGTCDPVEHICVTCSDGIKNGTESDVDCGGTCSTKCEGGKACNEHKDCSNGVCEGKVCSSKTAETADPNVLVINEVFDSSSSSPSFPLNDDYAACEFIEIANTSDKSVKVDGLSIEMKRTDDDKKKTTTIPLNGVIPAKNLLVVHTCDDENLPLPDDAVALWKATREIKEDGDVKISRQFSITSSATYEMVIASNTAKTDPITVDINQTKTKSSYTRSPEFSSDSTEMILTTSVEGAAFASPGYCMNGGTYSKNCQDGKPIGGITLTACNAGGAQCTEEHAVCTADKDERISSGYCVRECYDNGDCDALGENWGCFRFESLEPGFDPDNFDPDGGEPGICFSYSNKILDFLETDVDCGCSICSEAAQYEGMPANLKCSAGKKCGHNEDCLSGECISGVCSNVSEADLASLLINEVMAAPDTKKPFDLQTTGKQCDFVEIINTSEDAMDMAKISLSYIRVDEGHGPDNASDVKSFALSGVIPAKGAFLVLGKGCEIPALPGDVNTMAAPSDNFLTASPAAYELRLVKGEDMSESVTYNPSASGYSANRENDRDPASALKSNKDRNSEYSNTPGYCDNGGLFSENCVVENTCNNNEKDGTESDTDCGGKCAKCANGKTCNLHTDCDSSFCDFEADGIGVCADFVCEEDNECGGDSNPGDWHCVNKECVKCDDGKKNGYETDTDCGGPHCGACDIGQSCKEPSDCISNECSGGHCTGDKPEMATIDDLIVNEVMLNDKSGASKFVYNNDAAICKFVEIVNVSSKSVDLSTCSVTIQRTDNETKKSTTKLSGIVKPKTPVVVHTCSTLPLPQNAVSIALSGKSNLSQTAPAVVFLKCGEEESDSIVLPAVEGTNAGTSNNLPTDLVAASTMILHSSIEGSNGVKASPGYCVNGGLFSEDCWVDTSAVSKLFINEVMLSPKLSGLPLNPVQNIYGCKFLEIVNLDAKNAYSLVDEMAVVFENLDDSSASKIVIPLEGSIAANSAYVVWSSACTSRIELPEGVQSMTSDALESVLLSKNWGISVESLDEDAPESTNSFIWTKKESGDGISETHYPDRDRNSSIVAHTENAPADWNASPGYCVNGGLFTDNCVVPTPTP